MNKFYITLLNISTYKRYASPNQHKGAHCVRSISGFLHVVMAFHVSLLAKPCCHHLNRSIIVRGSSS